MIESLLGEGGEILDVGCGTGHLAGELMRRGYAACGIDLSDAMVEYSRKNYGADQFRVGDIENIPYPAHTFDGIMCLGVMEYLDQDEAALREIWRVLKPGGHAVITTPNAICPFYYMDMAYRRIRFGFRPLLRFVRYTAVGQPIPQRTGLPAVVHRRYHKANWWNMLRSAGLEPVDWVCHSWGWYSLDRFIDQGAFCRVSDRFARDPTVNWIASDQLVCVRAK
jgi:ubiquinone/menaquinone biosynthesis C-methylase UbiE